MDGHGIFTEMTTDGYEQVVFCHDDATGLRSIIVVHDTTLGPALGGVRMWPYRSEDEALSDCLRLAKAMTYKAAAAGVSLGGGKSVIVGDPATDKDHALLRAHGRFIATLGGRYIPGIDIGTSQEDLRIIGLDADPVSCVKGDPSPMTALGVLEGIRACLKALGHTSELAGTRVAVQGVGHVGSALARLLVDEGASIVVADLVAERARALAHELDCEFLSVEEILTAPCDVFAPCAMGAIINNDTISGLRCAAIAGAANDVLAADRHADVLAEAGILYAPDFVVNAGGLIFLEEEMLGQSRVQAEERVRRVGETVALVIGRAHAEGTSTLAAARSLCAERLAHRRHWVHPRC